MATYTVLYKFILSIFYILLLVTDLSHQCGPGAGGRRRRPGHRQVPLVYKQSVPNVSENTLAASGPEEGKITRNSTTFKSLVKSYNPDIIFRQEEGTDADRIMTQTCKDRLNTLAIAVMNQWQGGIRLRVTEAWDEDDRHARNSLHYEGRAVDITTSDRDRSKYGMLAALAVEAGFDWVYYESRGHIHCSVKSESAQTARAYGGCFTGSQLVTLQNGATTNMADLRVGDNVLTLDSEGRHIFSPVILFFHQDHDRQATFIRLQTDSGDSLELTSNHLLFLYRTSLSSEYHTGTSPSLLSVFARDIRVGDYVLLESPARDHKMRKARVVSIASVVRKGVFAPLTLQGTIVVNNVFSSCYAYIKSHEVAHAALLPMRLVHALEKLYVSWFTTSQSIHESLTNYPNRTDADSLTIQGVHWYAFILHNIAEWILPSSWLLA